MGELSEMGYGNVPIVVHALGNGGCQVLEEMEKRIFETISKPDLEILLQTPASSGVATPSLNYCIKSSSTRSLTTTSSIRSLSTRSPPSIKQKSVKKNIHMSKDDEIQLSHLYENSELTKDFSKMIRSKHNKTKSPGSSTTQGCVDAAPSSIISLQCTPELKETSHDYKVNSSQAAAMAKTPSMQEHRRLRRRRTDLQVKRVDVERVGADNLATPRYNFDERAYKRDIETFSSRLALGCIVFDSAPYFPSLEKETAAAEMLLSSHAMKLLVRTAVLGSYGIQGLNHFNYLGYLPTDESDGLAELSRPNQFWARMKNLRLSKRHAFIYSDADRICDENGIKKIIECHRANEIEIVTETVIDGSPHLGHRSWRDKEYAEFVGKVIDSLDGYKLPVEEENMSDWFDD
eukprot:CAMPEP_0178931004 /NCGR_PEP_ID=MMETSP0786-20121207/21642_1 /TAXON_ID=186022 /ORGANISM="Thalassionema frauenfeldii, Strain CCMP 1798" /LENGTH=403 /DNA_ID=CAMNT_0020607779 /DNA_START=197 /DNA_END=1408 /DNA_ORIENTATION=+